MAEALADDEGYDRLRNFFEACWHVKDHALADLPKQSHRALEDAVQTCLPLVAVADVANRSKHVHLTKKDRVGAAVTFKAINASEGPRRATATYQVSLADGSEYEAFELADQALQAWSTLLPRFGL